MSEDKFKKIISHAKEYGFVFPSSEIYDGLGAIYDYGQNGAELKKNIKDYWWKAVVHCNENVVGIDSAIFMHPTIWKASGHVDNFSDPLIDNKDSQKRYRADELIEGKAAQYKKKGKTEKADKILKDLNDCMNDENLQGIKEIIEEHGIACPESGSKNWTDVRQFNLMFGTKMGSLADDSDEIYLRPETAQGIFVNYLNVQKTSRKKIPFGIAQIGKAFRNEIVARQFIFRTREFEQMEMQFFVRPGEEMKWFEHWKETRMKWHKAIGISEDKLQFHEHTKLAHYANAAFDIEYEFPFGFKEVEGIHSRTDFDLKQHEKFSGKKLQYFDNEINENYVPYVVETSIGVDRMFLMAFCEALQEEEVTNGDKTETRTVLKLHPCLAPIKAAILPLTKKDGLPEKAREIFDSLKFDFNIFYEEKDTIGKRYRRMDAIGTPYCITVDHDSLDDNTVTLRDRDTMTQERVNANELRDLLLQKVDFAALLGN
ncbi:glycine--tRNA ligase [Sphingobacteriaceae bacterium AH-315-L07]|nr:glycine--tRNA ligase [Sphingobacteriaceae bacterium AH-315-L07]